MAPLAPSFEIHARARNLRASWAFAVWATACQALFWPTDPILFANEPALIGANAWARGGVILCGLATLGAHYLPVADRMKELASYALFFIAITWAGYHIGSAAGLESPWFAIIFAGVPCTSIYWLTLRGRIAINTLAAAGWTAGFLAHPDQNADNHYTYAVLAFATFVVFFTTAIGEAQVRVARAGFHAQQALAVERERADQLLLQILPENIATRLKGGEKPIADSIDEVTVLFADIVGFTVKSSELSADQVVALLEEAFRAFDALAAKHGLEKIKTIGDAYMAAAGVPTPHPRGAVAVADMALEMQDVADGLMWPDGTPLKLRVGLHTGKVVAGVLGATKFSYDLWGDTVNTASRMESHGSPGRVHISEDTANALNGTYTLEQRGTIRVKGKGEMATFWLERPT